MDYSDITLSFSDFADSQEFNSFCRILADLLELHSFAIRDPEDFSGPGRMLSPRGLNPLCLYIQSSDRGRSRCERCDRKHVENVLKTRQPHSYTCHAGLKDFIVPIVVNHQVIAIFIGGQFLAHPPSEAGFKTLNKKLNALNLNSKKLRQYYFNSPYFYKSKIKRLIELVTFFSNYFCEMGIRLRKSDNEKLHPAVRDAMIYMRDHYRDELPLTKVADHVYLTPTYFSTLFRKQTGVSFTGHLHSLRIDKAKQLLERSHLSITKIAFRVGFGSFSHFYRIFHQFENISPSKYRQKHLL